MKSVACIELHCGHIGAAGHTDACLLAFDNSVLRINAAFIFQDVAVIESAALFQVDIIRVDVLTDGLGRVKIKGRSRNLLIPADGDHRGIGGRDLVAVDPHDIVEDGAVALAVQVEVGVVGEVDRRLFVRRSGIVNAHFAVLKDIRHAHLEIPGIVLLAVGRENGEPKLVPHHFMRPDLLVEAVFAAVQVIAAVIAIKLIGRSVDRELSLADTVAESADECAQIAAVVLIACHIIVAENDVRGIPVFIGYDDALNDAAVIENGRLICSVRKVKRKHFSPVLRLAEDPCRDHSNFPPAAFPAPIFPAHYNTVKGKCKYFCKNSPS